jgi:hypothetical protein
MLHEMCATGQHGTARHSCCWILKSCFSYFVVGKFTHKISFRFYTFVTNNALSNDKIVHCMETCGHGGIVPPSGQSRALAAPAPEESKHLSYKRPHGHPNHPRRCGVQKNFLPLTRIEPRAVLYIFLSLFTTSLYVLVVRVPDYTSRGPGFDSGRYQIFWKVVDLERGPL